MTFPYSTDTAGDRNYAQSQLSAEAKTFNWLLDSFTSNTAGVVEAIAVSSDGLLMAMSVRIPRADADKLAATVSGLTTLATSAAYGVLVLSVQLLKHLPLLNDVPIPYVKSQY